MSKYVSPNGVSGYSGYEQCLVWHYRTDIDRDVLNRWFVNVFNQGIVYYVPNPDTDTSPSTAGGTTITISLGTSFLIKQKETGADGDKIAKGDMVQNYEIDISGYGDDTYNIVGVWENEPDEYRGIEFYLYTDAEVNTNLIVPGYNYIIFGQVEIYSGMVVSNTTTAQTQGSMYSGLAGWSGWSGYIGATGLSGISGYSGVSGYSGTSGTSGTSGVSGEPDTGPSGWSGVSGYSSLSGWSGESGFSGVVGESGWSGTAASSFVYSGADTIDENNIIVIPVYRGVTQTNEVTLKLWGQRFPTYHYTELPGHDHSGQEFATVAHTHIQDTHRHSFSDSVNSGAGTSHTHGWTGTASQATSSSGGSHSHTLWGHFDNSVPGAPTGTTSIAHTHTITPGGSVGAEASHKHTVAVSGNTGYTIPTNQNNADATAIPSDGIVPSTTVVNTVEKDFLNDDVGTSHVGIYVDTTSSVDPGDLGTRYTILTGGKWADLVNLNEIVGATIDIKAEAPASGFFFIKINNTLANTGGKILWHIAIN